MVSNFVEDIQDQSKSNHMRYINENWHDAEGDGFGEKHKDLARSWKDGGKEDGMYHYDVSSDVVSYELNNKKK